MQVQFPCESMHIHAYYYLSVNQKWEYVLKVKNCRYTNHCILCVNSHVYK